MRLEFPEKPEPPLRGPFSRGDLLWILIMVLAGSALGFLVNALSPRGFDLLLAAGLKP